MTFCDRVMSHYRTKSLRTLLSILFGTAIVVSLVYPVSAQEANQSSWRVLPFSGKFANLNPGTPLAEKTHVRKVTLPAEKTHIRKVLAGNEPVTDRFDDYFKAYFFPLMTQPEELGNVAKLRQSFFREYFARTKLPAVRLQLTTLALRYARGLAGHDQRRGNFHPAVRYNAMMMIGDLNEKDAVRIGGGKGPADPLPAALDILLAELTSPTQIDAVRIAALTGILRHVRLDQFRNDDRRIPAATRQEIVETIVAVVNQKDPPQGRTADGQYWMRRQAVDILGALGTAGDRGVVALALAKIIQDKDARLLLRCESANALGHLRGMKLDPEAAGRSLGTLALDAMAAEIDKLNGTTPDIQAAVRCLRYELHCILQGLGDAEKGTGLIGLAKGNQQTYLGGVIKAINATQVEWDNEWSNAIELADKLADKRRDLQRAVGSAAPEKAPATDTPADEGPGTTVEAEPDAVDDFPN